MASYTYSTTPLSISITVRGVSSGTVVRFFVRTDPAGRTIVDKKYTASGSSLTKTFAGLSENTDYAVNAGIVSGNDTIWIGTKYFTTSSESSEPDTRPERPDDWEWWSTIRSGRVIDISAKEWRAFCDRINEFRDYDDLRSYGFTYVRSGDEISASIVNEAISAISSISGHGTLPDWVYRGDPIAADFFLRLKNALNRVR